jgi:hypothetical protein
MLKNALLVTASIIIGAGGVQLLHAQSKSPAYSIALMNPDLAGKPKLETVATLDSCAQSATKVQRKQRFTLLRTNMMRQKVASLITPS